MEWTKTIEAKASCSQETVTLLGPIAGVVQLQKQSAGAQYITVYLYPLSEVTISQILTQPCCSLLVNFLV